MDDSETITNGDRHKGLHYIFDKRSGLIKHFKRQPHPPKGRCLSLTT